MNCADFPEFPDLLQVSHERRDGDLSHGLNMIDRSLDHDDEDVRVHDDPDVRVHPIGSVQVVIASQNTIMMCR